MFTRLNAAVVAVIAQAPQFNPDPAGMPGGATFNQIGSWVTYVAYGMVVMAVMLGAALTVGGRISHNSRMAGSGFGIAIVGIVAGFIIANATGLVDFGGNIGL